MARSIFGSLIPRISGALAVLNISVVSSLASANDSFSEEANNAKNLARINCGARITSVSESETGAKSAADLLLDDNTLSCDLTKGDHTFLISLADISNVDRFAFINEHLSGTVQIFVSNYRLQPNDSNWVGTGRKLHFGGERFVSVSLGAIEAKYLKISFDLEKPESIAGVSVYGQRTLRSFADQKDRLQAGAARIAYTSLTSPSRDNLNFNFANLYARARVVAVSSGAQNLVKRMIDDDPTTSFDFAADDPHPTVVVELEADQRLRRISAVYEKIPGQLDIYLLNTLPTADTFENTRPVVTVRDTTATGKAAAEFYPRGARYVALRWTPAVGLKVRPKFKIAEIGAFSDLTLGVFDLQAIPEQLAQSGMVVDPTGETPVVLPISP